MAFPMYIFWAFSHGVSITNSCTETAKPQIVYSHPIWLTSTSWLNVMNTVKIDLHHANISETTAQPVQSVTSMHIFCVHLDFKNDWKLKWFPYII
jgi:hypothetical protein